MALIKCKECSNQISDTAKACPNCGAKVKKPVTLLQGLAVFFLVPVVISGLAQLTGLEEPPKPTAQQRIEPPEQPKPKPKEVPVSFDLPLQTKQGTLVCPLFVAIDKREGHGLEAAMKSRYKVFGRQEAAEKAGCQEWREGLPLQLADDEKQLAKKWQANHDCGMLLFDRGYVFSCDLQNINGSETAPQASMNHSGQILWNTPATLSGTFETGTFNNCCTNGQAIKDQYSFLRLDKKIDIEPSATGEPEMRHVDAVQLGGKLPNLNSGQHAVIACKEVWYGSTGHYALPVYCTDPSVQ